MFVDSADRTPHYSLRKLSVGVASVLLSTTLWMGANGSVAHAATINDATVAEKVENDPSGTQTASNGQTQSQNGQGQDAASVVTGANQTKNKEGSSVNAEAQTATANDAHAQADVAKQEPAAQSQQTAPQAQVPASAERRQASTAEQAAGQASAAATEGQTNGSANADAANNATTEEKKDSANPEANSSAAATEDAKNESTPLDVSQAFKMHINKKMVMASLASADKLTNMVSELEKAKEDTTAVPGFSVTDPKYPDEMYRDPNPDHYSFFWAGGLTGKRYHYQTVISTNRNGDGQIHVFELDQSNGVLDTFDLDKNKSHKSLKTGATYFNDEYAGLINAGSDYVTVSDDWGSDYVTVSRGELTIKYEVSGDKSDKPYNKLSFIVPRLNTQVTSYHDEKGKDIIDKNRNKIEPVVQRGLDGQKYTTTGTKVIDGYYAKAPSNAQGTMSPYGKGNTYEKKWHDGYSAEFTQINDAGDMSVQMYHDGTPVNWPIIIKPGDSDVPSGVDNIYLRSIYVPQTTDIRYVYKKLGTTFFVGEDNKPFMGKIPTQYPNDKNDPTKAGKVVIPQYKGYTPKIDGKPVGPDGFIPGVPVGPDGFMPTDDPGKDTYVVYTPDAQKATVAYVDDKTGETLKTTPLSGKTNAKSGYTTAKDIQAYKDLGYVLVSDDTNGAEIVFDKDDDKDQSYTVHFNHDTVTVTPDKPGQPGQPINPGKGSASYPDGTDKAGLTDTVNRNITYKMSDGSQAPAAVNDQLSYTATKVIDKVTGKVLSTEWSGNQDFKDVESPVVKGYTPDKTVVSNKNIAHDAQDINVVVTYTADAQKATVAYVDDKTGETLKTTPLSGKTNAKSGYTTAKDIQAYKDLGYVLVSDDTNGAEIVFDKDDDKDQSYTVHFNHDTVTVTPENPGKQTVTYVYKDKNGKVVKTKTVEQDTTFTGKTTKDEVTGETTTTWEQKNHTYKPVNTPVEPGYTADKKIVGGETVTPDNPNRSYTVVYTPNGSIVPVDPNGNPIPNTPSVPYETDPTDPTKVVDGKVPEVPGWTPKNGKPGAPVKPSDPTKDTKVSYDHTMTTGDTQVEGKQTVTYVYKDKNGKVVKTAEPAKTISIKESAQAQDQLPQTGEDNSKAALGLGLASILGGIGILGAFKRKKKEN